MVLERRTTDPRVPRRQSADRRCAHTGSRFRRFRCGRMSGKLIGWAMQQATGSSVTKLVLVKLADNANESGFCCASLELIVKHTELSERAVREHLYRLERLQLVKVERRKVDG